MTCRLDRDETSGVATLVLTNVAQRNAFSAQLAVEFDGLLGAVERDPSNRALILAAEGSAFCVGGDVALFAEQIERGRLVDRVATDVAAFNLLVHRLASMRVPVIAALHGAVAGGGVALAAACDFRVATPDAFFVPGFIGIGLPPDTGSSWLLARLIGAGRATDFLMRNRRLDAETALAWGLVTEVATDSRARSDELAAELAQRPPAALAETKALIASAFANTFAQQLDAEEAAVIRSLVRDEIAEGVLAFRQKRPAAFSNRSPR